MDLNIGEKLEKRTIWIAFLLLMNHILLMKSTVTKLQVRMDRNLKDSAEEIFAEIGLDTTTAVRLFFTKVAQTGSIPFQLKVEPEFSPEAEARILAAWEESKDPANRIGPFLDMRELIKNLHDEVAKDEVKTVS